MRYLSVCSGIEAASMAWAPLGWSSIAFSEIEPFPCKVLKHHYPQVPNLGDMTKFKEWPDYANVDVLVGGTPCQSFSIAGLRKGLADPRGNLMLTYLAIAAKYRPTWVVWENVPGVLSSNGGKDFGTFLAGLGECGYGFAYRVLDAQYVRTDGYPHAVPQRRRRVFVVGHLGDWRRAAAVLFDSESLRGNPPPSREAGKTVAGTISKCSFSGGASGRPEGAAGNHFLPVAAIPVCMSTGQAGAEIGVGTTLNCNHEAPIAFCLQHAQIGRKDSAGPHGKGYIQDVAFTQDSRACADAVAFAQNTRDEVREMQVVGALAAQPGMKQTSYIRRGFQVRRLMPIECERLQGFPDDFTLIPGSSDTTRYKALGNSMAVNSMQLIGQRIQMVSEIAK